MHDCTARLAELIYADSVKVVPVLGVNMFENLIYFAHGKESDPWGAKIEALAEVAWDHGFHVESPDYRGISDPDARVNRLLDLQPLASDTLILVGSSMGGYVSAAASEKLTPAGLFLLAPAVFMPDWGRHDLQPDAQYAEVVHGWHDDIVPLNNVQRFAEQHAMALHILNGDHRLLAVLPDIQSIFERFLLKTLAR